MQSGQRHTPSFRSRWPFRRAAAFIIVAVVAVVLYVVFSRGSATSDEARTDSLNVAVRICDRQIDSLLRVGNGDDDTGDLRHCMAYRLLICRDSLISVGATAVCDTLLTHSVYQALILDTAILQAKIGLFSDMPRLQRDLLDRLRHSREALITLSNRK